MPKKKIDIVKVSGWQHSRCDLGLIIVESVTLI